MTESYQHCVFVCSNYTNGSRTGLHFLYNESNISSMMEMIRRYSSKAGVAFYFIVTESVNINSIKEKDAFFRSIDIIEGTDGNNVVKFNDAINNQIKPFDVAALLLSRNNMTARDLKTYMFYIYCIYVKENNSMPFIGSLFFNEDIKGFKAINKVFDQYLKEENAPLLKCTKPNIILSKFFNCEGGVELMNKLLKIYYELRKKDINYLSNKIDEYYEKAKNIYRQSFGGEKRYPFKFTKKIISRLDINAD